MDNKKKRKRFGRYLILDHLVDGGMAKICRARFLGEQADKIVVIKMVQSRFSRNEAFKKMFMSEIKVTFDLLHSNIVQTYDYGFHKDQIFVVMEYCDGRNLKEYLNRLKESNYIFPIEISTYIISQVCQGLHYAHTYINKLSGKSANIIHRDISPHNIMLTYDGSVKIIDFGIAKADTNEDETQVGTIKGKLSYLAPEYIEGFELDHRYDQFAVGLTLWEMLSSQKLFQGSSDLDILKKVQACKIPPPSSFNSKVPPELDEIVMKTLKRDRNERFENMDQLNRSLIKFLYSQYPEFNASDLNYFANRLFKDEIKKDSEKLFEYGQIDLSPYLEDLKKEQKGSEAKQEKKEKGEKLAPDTDSNIKIDEKGGTRYSTLVIDFNKNDIEKHEEQKPILDVKQGTSVKNFRKDLNTNLKGPAAMRKQRGRYTKPKKEEESLEKSSKLKSSFAILFILLVIAGAGLSDHVKGYLCQMGVMNCLQNVVQKKTAEDKNTSLIGLKEKQDSTYLVLKNFNKRSMKAYVNGVRQKVDIFNQIEIPINKALVLRVERIKLKHFVKKIKSQGNQKMIVEVPQMPKELFGYLVMSSSCRFHGELHFNLYGEKRVEKLPLQNSLGIPFPINGDGRTPASFDGKAHYPLYYKIDGEKLTTKKKIYLKFNEVGEQKDFCDLL